MLLTTLKLCRMRAQHDAVGVRTMTKRDYFNLAMQQELHWLAAIILEETRFQAMPAIYVALIKLAIRKKGGAA